VNSLVNQTFKDIEIILVNDGSTDKSGKIIEEIASNDYRIKVIHQKNGGSSSARNKGIELASSKYIMFVDSDDVLVPDAVEHLYYCISKTDADIVMYRNRIEYYNVKGYEEEPLFNKDITLKYDDIREKILPLFLEGPRMNAVWKNLYKRDLLTKGRLRFREGHVYGEDLIFNLEAFTLAKKILYTPKIIYIYNIRNGSITTSYPSISTSEIKTLYEEMKKYVTIWEMTENTYKVDSLFVRRLCGRLLSIFTSSNGPSLKIRFNHAIKLMRDPFFKDLTSRATIIPLRHKVVIKLVEHKCYKITLLLFWGWSLFIRLRTRKH
jgi:glycosyltransferase involved in cell wall biosynthesis